jgi:TonB family protein
MERAMISWLANSLGLIFRSFLFLSVVCLSAFMPQSSLKDKLDESSWVGEREGKVSFVLEFRKNGTLLYIDSNGAARTGKWTQHMKTIEMDVQRGYIKLKGVVEDGRMNGTSTSKTGNRWEWVATQQPLIAERSIPKYPALAAAARIDGVVIVDVIVNASGQVADVHAISGHPILRKVCEDSARGWRFQATDRDSLRTARLLFVFRVLDKEKDETVVSPVFLSPYRIEIRRGIPSVQYSEPHAKQIP